ncbi:hypothetical protein C2845_PM12G19160 [Panicum miliaceum]|uniref:Replication factor A C-terminal domain-containing protein n=1 Tax=Panicum miliaceum TaxID=4540 RepID=A0A3L6QI22_PANMI|nr:hypothetical protein C2845_PM12G19160 [Panicum miliaceum]
MCVVSGASKGQAFLLLRRLEVQTNSTTWRAKFKISYGKESGSTIEFNRLEKLADRTTQREWGIHFINGPVITAGNTIYAEIPHTQIDKHASTIQENGIYVMSRFKVANLKNSYRPVHASYMIEITCFTRINVAKDPPSTFPKYVYNLIEFDDLYNLVGDQTYFLDVLGVIIEVNQPEWRHLSNQPNPALTRNLIIRNIELQNECVKIKFIDAALIDPQLDQPPPPLEERNLEELNNMDPYDFPQTSCRCTVTIVRLIPNVVWWFPSCNMCSKACAPEGYGYRCRKCNYKNYKYKLKLPFIGSDGTAESEMICFGDVASKIVGKSAEYVMNSCRRRETIPPNIAVIISLRFTFGITMTNESYHTEAKTYLITSVITSHGRQRRIPRLPTNTANLPGTSRDKTPPSTPYAIETGIKDAPLLEMDTPSDSSTRKRLFSDKSIEKSVYNEILKFLHDVKILSLDDYNYEELQKTKSELFSSKTFLMFSEESEHMMENELNFKVEGYKNLKSILRTACEEAAPTLPISIHYYKGQWDEEEQLKITYNGQTPPSTSLEKLANSLIQINENIKSYGYELTESRNRSPKYLCYCLSNLSM